DPQEVARDTPYIGLADMPQGSIALDTWGMAGDSISGKRLMKKGQILFGKLRPYFKKVGVAPVDGVCSTDILVIVPKLPVCYSLVLCQLTQQDFIDYTTAVSDGTRMPRVSWQMMAKYPIVLPKVEVIERFNKIVEPWIHIIINNVFENRALAITRDYLLPRLLSGAISVEAAEEVVADAG
ncbi:MAG: restriction endonuclease subunit S, partial [Roseiflexaceae bacterium]